MSTDYRYEIAYCFRMVLALFSLIVGMAHAAPPVVVSLSPTNSASQVQPDTDMVATFDQVSSLVDGVWVGADTSLGNVAAGQLQIGGKSQYMEDMIGCITEVAIWEEALSEVRIQALADGERPIPAPPRLARS